MLFSCGLLPGTGQGIFHLVRRRVYWPAPQGTALLVDGDFNANLAEPEGHVRCEVILVVFVTEGIKDMAGHFLLRHISWERYGWTWSMLRQGHKVKPRTE